jgi:FkbM family methyltransferase
MRLAPRDLLRHARRRRQERRMAGPRLVKGFAEAHPSAVFVQIGANDGEQHDFLRPYILRLPWHGVIVEPVPYVFERLARSYAGQDGIVLENVAIAAVDGPQPFHHLAEAADHAREGLPRWYDGIGSLSRENVVAHAPHIPDIEQRIVTTDVSAVTFETLCDRNGLESLDLLLIDTEGYDWEIIRQVDLATRGPRLLVYEHYHLDAGDRRGAREHLHRAGYETMEEHFDTFCLDTSRDDGLTRLWRRLEPAVPGVAAYEEAA